MGVGSTLDNWEGRGKRGGGGEARKAAGQASKSITVFSVKQPVASLVVILHSVKDCYGLNRVSPRKIREILTPGIPETDLIWKQSGCRYD